MDLRGYLFLILFCDVSFSPSSGTNCNHTKPGDIIFLLDGSGSVGVDNFRKVLKFVNSLVDAFQIGPSFTQVSVAVFTQNTVNFAFQLNTFTSKDAMKNNISSIGYPWGGQDFSAALDQARYRFMDTSFGSRPSAAGIVVLVTDGQNYPIEPSITSAQKLKDMGITVYTAGVGSYVDRAQLERIASFPNYYFSSTDFTSIDELSGPITQSACDEIEEWDDCKCLNGGTCVAGNLEADCVCPPIYAGFYCDKRLCQPSIADIVFVLDSSVSQTEAQFNKQLEFINQFIDQIVIGEENLQVGVVTYSFEAKIEIYLGQHSSNETLKEAVSNIKYRPGATFTDKGLEAAADVFMQAPNNRQYGKTVKRYVYVMTDGMSNNRRKTEQKAADLKSYVNKVLAIGIGKEVSHKELLAIASEDVSLDRKYVYSVQNFDALYTILKDLVSLTCDECTRTTSSDIVLLLDMSPLVALDDFQSALNAITYLTHEAVKVENEHNTIRIGLVTYGTEITLHRPLNDSTTEDKFLTEVQGIVLEDAHCSVTESECDIGLDEALAYVRGTVFESQTSTMKSDTREMIIVLTNGQNIDKIDKLDIELGHLKAENRAIYAIALGEHAMLQTLQKVVGDPALVFSLYDETQLSILDALTTNFFSSSCELSNDFVNDP